jgi:CRISPR-associated endonuclease/helicase Cas3
MLAHSKHINKGVISPQLYSEHVLNVSDLGRKFVIDMLSTSGLNKKIQDYMLDVISLATIYHDIGKLDEQAQTILSSDYSDDNERMLNHVDAGVGLLLSKYELTKNLAYLDAAFLVYAHHIGLQNYNPMALESIDKTNRITTSYVYRVDNSKFRDNSDIFDKYNIESVYKTVSKYVDSNIDKYEKIHNSLVDVRYSPITDIKSQLPLTAFQIRMVFSCLVDADHTDTENFYSQIYTPFEFSELNPSVRLEILQTYIGKLPVDNTVSKKRLESRKELHRLCANVTIPNDYSFFVLDGSVGLGKTLSGSVYTLRLAIQKNAKRIYNILPFTNIISQNVNVFRKSLLIPGEDMNNVNEIHSKCEFDKIWMRKYSNRWNAPINVSTAVQWVESLCCSKTRRIRKLHWFANSVFFLDEFDKMMPHDYWEYVLSILKDMAENFNCSFIFSSGTSAYYWDIMPEIDIDVHDIILSGSYKKFQKLEKQRVKIKIQKRPIKKIDKFIDRVFSKLQTFNSGLIVCNTIYNSTYLFSEVKKNMNGFEVYLINGYQSPIHKEKILKNIKESLKDISKKVLVISTSVIECGVDISFDIGWREKCDPLQVLQFLGRINRGSKLKNSVCYVFEFDKSIMGNNKTLSVNLQNRIGIEVFNSLDSKSLTPSHCTAIVENNLERSSLERSKTFLTQEQNKQFQEINDSFKIIDTATAIIIVNKDLIARIENETLVDGKIEKEYIQYNEIVRNSIQLWFTTIEKIQELVDLKIITGCFDKEYYVWNDEYDDEMGIGRIMLNQRQNTLRVAT